MLYQYASIQTVNDQAVSVRFYDQNVAILRDIYVRSAVEAMLPFDIACEAVDRGKFESFAGALAPSNDVTSTGCQLLLPRRYLSFLEASAVDHAEDACFSRAFGYSKNVLIVPIQIAPSRYVQARPLKLSGEGVDAHQPLLQVEHATVVSHWSDDTDPLPLFQRAWSAGGTRAFGISPAAVDRVAELPVQVARRVPPPEDLRSTLVTICKRVECQDLVSHGEYEKVAP